MKEQLRVGEQFRPKYIQANVIELIDVSRSWQIPNRTRHHQFPLNVGSPTLDRIDPYVSRITDIRPSVKRIDLDVYQ